MIFFSNLLALLNLRENVFILLTNKKEKKIVIDAKKYLLSIRLLIISILLYFLMRGIELNKIAFVVVVSPIK